MEENNYDTNNFTSIARRKALESIRDAWRKDEEILKAQIQNKTDHNIKFNNSYPIKFSNSELSWGSIKLNKTENKSITITNCSSKILNLETKILSKEYSLQNLENDYYFTLQPFKSHTLIIKFCPTLEGLCVGTLKFILKKENSLENKKTIRLCGYGGHSRLIPKHIQIAPEGCKFLEIGELTDLGKALKKKFSIINTGSLDGFVIIIPKSNKINFENIFESIKIEPTRAIVPAGENVNFKLIFKPTRSQIKSLFSEITAPLTIADLKLILGDEPNRHRIRKLMENCNDLESSLLNSEHFKFCCDKINGEKLFTEFTNLKESSEAAFSLCSSIIIKNISVTLNYSMEHTINHLTFVDDNETIMYRNILIDDNNISHQYKCIEAWSVKPNLIAINRSNSKILRIKSYLNGQNFQITSNFMRLLTIIPSKGLLSSNDCIDVKLSVPFIGFLPQQQIYITINIENENIVIPVNIII